MTIEQAIEELKVEYLGDTYKIRKAKDMAIKSLDMWDKVIKELEKDYKEYENVLADLDYSDGLGYALAIIEERLKEIEECTI